ncbi:MAG: chemotaxis protein CheX [Chitinivibrionales bacterium]|nr:chemotaxis protein CheX [Chitinivibrionales bacterium]MBD3395415.1 chemotaxis protein CheX [Chitinivibrionales bacterium]
MDVAYVNPFIQSTINTFKTMIDLDVKPGKPALSREGEHTYDVSGIIGLSGKAQGSIALSFPKSMALKIVSKMLEQQVKVIGPELTDGIGELTNIVAGSAKAELSPIVKDTLSISLPNVVVGKNHSVTRPSGLPGIVVPFSSSIGDFAVEIALKTG